MIARGYFLTGTVPLKERKLAVILHADVVGSTGLVRRHELVAHERIQSAFRRLTESIGSYAGTTHEIRGDALVAEFARASDAVCAALQFQQFDPRREASAGDDVEVEIRVGIALGEEVFADGAVTGTGVVLAQRVEQLAEPGGVCITGAIHEAIPQRLPFRQESLGAQMLKGFEEPVHVYRVSLEPGAEVPGVESARPFRPRIRARHVAAIVAGIVLVLAAAAALRFEPWVPDTPPVSIEQLAEPLEGKPTIAVLPFANMSDDPEQEYFSEGISEDIITDLSRLSNLAVIARNSSFTYMGTSAKAQEIGRDLGARYLLEGSVRRAGERVRVTAQLIDASNGHHLWAERYDRLQTDIFELQDEITGKIVAALSIQLIGDEPVRLSAKPTNSFEAYDLFLKAQKFNNELTLQSLKRAEVLYRRAIELDPEFARAYGGLGTTLGRQFQLDFTAVDRQDLLDRALQFAKKAVTIDPTSPQAHWALGFINLNERQFEKAAKAVETAVTLSPNYADGWALLSAINNNMGRGDQALRFSRKARALNPHYSWNYPFNEGRAYYFLGNYEKAITLCLDALARNENALFPRLYLAASYVRLGKTEEAEWQATQLEVMNPGISVSGLKEQLPVSDGPHRDQLFNDLKEVGLPE